MGFELPPRSSVGTLSAEIAGEGERVIHSDGSITTNWSPPPARLVMPDWSEIKSIRHYFNRKGHQVWPAWFYHPTEKPRLIRNAEDGADLGVCYRRATNEERGKYGVEAVWDWKDGCEWRPQPYHAPKFDPANPGHGKEFIAKAPNPTMAQNALLEALIPTVTAAVVAALRSNGPAAPANVDAAGWDEFLQFQAFKKSSQAIDAVKDQDALDLQGGGASGTSVLANGLSEAEERTLWEDEAKRKGI